MAQPSETSSPTAHTPGPWRIVLDAGGWASLEPDVAGLGWIREGGDITPANAALIAAAPELLEALLGLFKWGLTHDPKDTLAWEVAAAAIAKARP